MTMQKVTLPHEVADAIEKLRAAGYDGYAFINAVSIDADVTYPDEVVLRVFAATGDGAMALMSALVNGYERELTEDEKREKAYAVIRGILTGEAKHPFDRGWDDGVLFTLRTLGIEIPGVNIPKQPKE